MRQIVKKVLEGKKANTESFLHFAKTRVHIPVVSVSINQYSSINSSISLLDSNALKIQNDYRLF
jgi:hypothetical protein